MPLVMLLPLQPANVFLDDAGNVKVGDFGLGRILGAASLCAKTLVGTPFYQSPGGSLRVLTTHFQEEGRPLCWWRRLHSTALNHGRFS